VKSTEYFGSNTDRMTVSTNDRQTDLSYNLLGGGDSAAAAAATSTSTTATSDGVSDVMLTTSLRLAEVSRPTVTSGGRRRRPCCTEGVLVPTLV